MYDLAGSIHAMADTGLSGYGLFNHEISTVLNVGCITSCFLLGGGETRFSCDHQWLIADLRPVPPNMPNAISTCSRI
jgi:hypothetical protein